MARWERYALSKMVEAARPEIAIEIGTRGGGSLQLISSFAQKVYAIDIDPACAQRCAPLFHNATFITGDSRRELPQLLRELASAEERLGFVLIDGDHSAEGVAADIDNLLEYRPRRSLQVLMHDSFNPECRRGILGAEWQGCEYVHYVEVDFVPGAYHELALDTAKPRTMWGGFAHALLLAEPRDFDLEIHRSQQALFDLVYPASAHCNAAGNGEKTV